MKTCKQCKEIKMFSNFYKHHFNYDGLSGSCKECDKEKVVNRYRTKKGLITHIYSNQKRTSIARKYRPPTYSKKEFINWMFSQPNFLELYNNWVKSNFKKELTPSIDRLNDYKSYTLKNIQLITWEDHCQKSYNDKKNGINTKICKSVTQYSANGVLIKTFYSISQAERETKINNAQISKVCLNKSNTAGGYIWRYAI
jgi:hypothetical protein